jgi:phenylalanyl-tRNA synthetase beta chain
MPTISIALDGITSRGIDRKGLPGLVDRLGMSVEKIDDKEITIEVTPNRPDLLEVNGLCRALKMLEGKTTPKENHYAVKGKPALKITVGKGVRRCRPFIAGFVAKEVDLKGNRIKELMNFQEKLHETYGRKRKKMAIGIHDLDRIEGDIVYDAAKEGKMVPLGSQKPMSFQEVMRFADEEEWDAIINSYRTYPHIRDSRKVMGLIPVLNSESTRISEATRNLFIEVTGTSWQTVNDTANILACLFLDTGARIEPCALEGGKVPFTPTLDYKEFKMVYPKIDRTLGYAFTTEDIIALANRMGYMAASVGSRMFFMVPPYRTDVINERDIIEDIAIAYGYDRIMPTRIFGASVGLPDELTEYSDSACSALIGMGFTEALNTFLTNEAKCFEMMERRYDKGSVVKVAYAKTETLSVLRDSILPSLLGNLSGSLQATMPQRLFEVGNVFRVVDGKVIESRNATFVSEHSRSNFSEIKSSVYEFMRMIGAPKFELKEAKDPAFIEGRCATLVVGGKAVGIFGEIHPKVLQNFGLEEPVAAAELLLELILALKK